MSQFAPIRRLAVRAAAVDASLLLGFAAIGRVNHDEGLTLSGVFGVAWPFLTGWAIAFFASGLSRDPLSPRRATLAWAVMLPLAIVGRRISGRGNDPAFVIVAATFTLACLAGWRALATIRRRYLSADQAG